MECKLQLLFLTSEAFPSVLTNELSCLRGSTPLYQLLTHALESPTNKTKFTLLFSNVTEKDILLREEFDALKKKYSDKFDLVYLVDKPSEGWKGQFIISDVA